MNKLKTKIEVSRVSEGKIAIIDQIIIGELSNNQVKKPEGFEVGFRYLKEDGTVIENATPLYTWDEVNTLWQAVKSSIPADATFEEIMNIALLEAFKVEMANTFGINTSEIEEIN
jgi:hypothetical protein